MTTLSVGVWRVAQWVLTIGVIAVLGYHVVHIWGLTQLRGEADIVYVFWFVEIAFAVLSIVCLRIARRSRPIAVGGAVVFLIFFAMSLRSWSFNGTSGDLTEYWAGVPVRHDTLAGYGSQAYCYDSSALFLGFRSGDGQTMPRYFLGIWPSRPSEKGIDRAFSFGRCAAS